MPDKTLCSCGCGKGAVKDGLGTKCYREKHGKPPFPKYGQKKDAPAGGDNGHEGHECEGCKVLQLQLDELGRAEKIMVADGLVPAEKFEQARQIVRDLHK